MRDWRGDAALLAGVVLGLLLPEAGSRASAQDPAPGEDLVARFTRAVEALAAQVRQSAPQGVTCQVTSLTPAALGWEAAPGTPAACLALETPAGARRALGLLPRRGRFAPRIHPPEQREHHPALLACGPDLVVVAAPAGPPAALGLEQVEAARAAFARALAPLDPWSEGSPVRPAELGAGLDGAVKATRFPHLLLVILPLDAPAIDPAQVLGRGGVTGLAWSSLTVEGVAEPPTIVFAD